MTMKPSCAETVVNVNPYATKKGSTQTSQGISLFSPRKSALPSAGSLFARKPFHSNSPSEGKEDYSACVLRKAEQTLRRLRSLLLDTNKAFRGLSQMMPWLFLRKKCRRIILIKSVSQPRRLASRRGS